MIGQAIAHGAYDFLLALGALCGCSFLLVAAWVAAVIHGQHRRERREHPVVVQLERVESEPHPLRVIGGHRGPAAHERAR